jgi:ribosomal protein L40E
MDMDEIMNIMKTGAATVIDETGKVTKSVVKKSGSLIEQTKLKIAMNEIENRMNNEYREIGQYVYSQCKEGAEFTEFVGEKCENLSKLDEELDEMLKHLADLKNSKVCPLCGAINETESNFCKECGAKI